MGVVAGLAAEFFPRPHLMLILWSSMSMPFAQASAARSAESRSLKFTNADFDFAMCTIDLSLSGFIEGSDLMTVVLSDCSVASAGNDDRNSDIIDSSSGGFRPWLSACFAIIL